MGDQLARAEEFEKKAEKKLMNRCAVFDSKYEDAADLFYKAANSFKLAKSWNKAGSTYIKLSNCHLKLDCNDEAAQAYVDAAHCYKTSPDGTRSCLNQLAISCLGQAVDMFCDIGRINVAARCCKEIAELYESEANIGKAMEYFERAADFFQIEEITISVNQCKQKIAQCAAQLKQYERAIDIYEKIAQQSLDNNLLKYGVKGHLLNAGLCHLCEGDDDIAIRNVLEQYQKWDPTFSRTRAYKLLSDIADAFQADDVTKFTDVVEEFRSKTQLDSWKKTLLLRVKEKLEEEPDLT